MPGTASPTRVRRLGAAVHAAALVTFLVASAAVLVLIVRDVDATPPAPGTAGSLLDLPFGLWTPRMILDLVVETVRPALTPFVTHLTSPVGLVAIVSGILAAVAKPR